MHVSRRIASANFAHFDFQSSDEKTEMSAIKDLASRSAQNPFELDSEYGCYLSILFLNQLKNVSKKDQFKNNVQELFERVLQCPDSNERQMVGWNIKEICFDLLTEEQQHLMSDVIKEVIHVAQFSPDQIFEIAKIALDRYRYFSTGMLPLWMPGKRHGIAGMTKAESFVESLSGKKEMTCINQVVQRFFDEKTSLYNHSFASFFLESLWEKKAFIECTVLKDLTDICPASVLHQDKGALIRREAVMRMHQNGLFPVL